MAASLLDNAEVFFQRFQQLFAELIGGDPKVREVLDWANRKVENETPTRVVIGRLNYLALGLIFDSDRSLSRERANECEIAYVRLSELGGTLKTKLPLMANSLTSLPLRINRLRRTRRSRWTLHGI